MCAVLGINHNCPCHLAKPSPLLSLSLSQLFILFFKCSVFVNTTVLSFSLSAFLHKFNLNPSFSSKPYFRSQTNPYCSYPKSEMDRNQEIALTQMRKSVEKLMSSTEKYGDPALMRFLIARSMDPDKAAKMFVQWQKWRTAFVPSGFISDSEVGDELGCKKIYLQDLSKNGHPVIIIRANKHFPSKDQLQFKKFVVHLLDKTIASSFKGREIGNEKLTAVLDFQQITFKNVDARALITGFQFLQAYYPERLAKCFVLNMPRFFVSVWRVVCRFLEKATLEKIVIVSNEDEMREFVREIGEEALPEEYGGRAVLMALQDVVLTPLVTQ